MTFNKKAIVEKYFDAYWNESTNTCIIGDREDGKTTTLLRIMNYYLNRGWIVSIIDSAVQHGNKSLINQIKKERKDWLLYESPSELKINNSMKIIKALSSKNEYSESKSWFPKIDIDKSCSLLLFDVSKYLEEGYFCTEHLKNDKLKNIKWDIYKSLVNQTIFRLLDTFSINQNQIALICDEIKFNSITFEILKACKNRYFSINVAVHNKMYLNKIFNFFDYELNLVNRVIRDLRDEK